MKLIVYFKSTFFLLTNVQLSMMNNTVKNIEISLMIIYYVIINFPKNKCRLA